MAAGCSNSIIVALKKGLVVITSFNFTDNFILLKDSNNFFLNANSLNKLL